MENHILLILAILGSISLLMRWTFKTGESSGSMYMLKYLKENGFLDDTGYIAFMQHMREEKRIKDDKQNGK